ncbi:MAG: Dam family site-specific DNA-(adenine-N6)-methyltransferase [Gammaproteobacteria bacterium]|nr:Dam family site-specific DNA-(adenine-N6)-methyltransferase [Gammaproteobacteria bacterium]
MSKPPLVPPIKCQGIKTKLVEDIQRLTQGRPFTRWVEPFCGSGVVPLNLQPSKALLCDSNLHIIKLYLDIQQHKLNALIVRDFLTAQGATLLARGEDYFYEVRERFNSAPTSLDFLFLNRSCFNGVMRFNKKGRFNVPFCRKPERFATAYITKISNQVTSIAAVISNSDWEFRVADFKDTLKSAAHGDLVYVDPPYAGRHVDYFNSWTDQDESDLSKALAALPCEFILSTWHSNEFRSNLSVEKNWSADRFHVFTKAHFYHVGSSEDLRHPMIEALVTNFPAERLPVTEKSSQQSLLLREETKSYVAV